jgi:uncharacterized protein with NRDE domain
MAEIASQAASPPGVREAPRELLFALLGDRTVAPDAELPTTGIPLARERLLSAPFIVSAEYGTRCSTVVAIGYDGAARFTERSFDPNGRVSGAVDERYRIAD